MSYRTPAEVVALAAQVLAGARMSDPLPGRQAGAASHLRMARVSLAATVAELAAVEVTAVAPGRVAVPGPSVVLPEATRALADAGLDPVDPR